MQNNIDILWWLLPTILLPVFFAMGWFAARVDLRAVLKQAKSVPSGFYRSLDALIDRKTGIAVEALGDILEQRIEGRPQADSFELGLSLGKLYRLRGENDKAIVLHQKLLTSPDLMGARREQVQFELGQDYRKAGLVVRAEEQFEKLLDSDRGKEAREILLHIYQQDRDWQKAIDTAAGLAHGDITYAVEIAQFYCERAQTAFFRSDYDSARAKLQAALETNKKCTRANMLLGDLESKEENYAAAARAYEAIERQNHEYLGMVGEKLFNAYAAQNKAEEGLNLLIGYLRTFPQLDLLGIIYDKALVLKGKESAVALTLELVRAHPDLQGIYHLLGIHMNDIDAEKRSDADMMRNVIARQMQKSLLYRCRHCHFKSQIFFWHCPACNKWETFTPNKIEV